MELNLPANRTKNQVFETVQQFLGQQGFIITDSDETRPWGGFFVIDELQSTKFIDYFFKGIKDAKKENAGKISPKILIVEKEKRLSWQYHHRRSEIWKVIGGNVGVVKSEDDNEKEIKIKKTGEIIILQQGERHRLIGLDSWGIIAEIWQHTDKNNPSNENDIIRLQDDFGR